MKARCLNPNSQSYADYGGRGIMLCEKWREFEPFYEWAKAAGYRKGLEIDRINNNAGYSPENCRFVTRHENAQNKRTTKLNPESVRDIRNMKLQGFTTAAIASKYDITTRQVNAVASRKCWSNID